VPPLPPTQNPLIERKTTASPKPDQTARSEPKLATVEPRTLPTRREPVRPISAPEPRPAPRFEFARHVPAPPSAAMPEPIIQVTIGRIEVRAVSEKTIAPKERNASPVMSLNDYLRSRHGGA
jgi:hypothetical protein